MGQSAGVWLVLAAALVAANLPFVNERLLEIGLLGAATLALGFAIEARIGQRQAQGWEFYAALACMFLTFAFPGFVWRYLRRRR